MLEHGERIIPHLALININDVVPSDFVFGPGINWDLVASTPPRPPADYLPFDATHAT